MRRGLNSAGVVLTTEPLPETMRQADRGPAATLLEANQTLVTKLGPPPARGAETLDNVR